MLKVAQVRAESECQARCQRELPLHRSAPTSGIFLYIHFHFLSTPSTLKLINQKVLQLVFNTNHPQEWSLKYFCWAPISSQ